MIIPQCTHLKPDGRRCGSPALRGKPLCYFHARPRPRPRPVIPDVPDPTDHRAVLQWVMRGLMAGTLDTKAAGQIIYGVQMALCK